MSDIKNERITYYVGLSWVIFIISSILIFILPSKMFVNKIILWGYIIVFINALLSILVSVIHNKNQQQEQKNRQEKINMQVVEIVEKNEKQLKTNYDKKLLELECPSNVKERSGYKLWVANGILYISQTFYAHLENYKNKINYFIVTNDLDSLQNFNVNEYDFKISVIPIENIKYFAKDGDISYETQITGGGGGGSSVKGAVIGGVIAGGAGSVIGSRQKTNEIKSETLTHDTRKTILKYYENNALQSVEYLIEFFDIFEELIPDKEYNIVVAKESLKSNSINNDFSNNVKDKLRQLNDFKLEGLITEEEYITKKQELLTQF